MDLGTREKVERLNVYSQIYHHLHCTWWNFNLAGGIFSLSAASVVGMYVGLRHTELPWYLYWLFWFGGFGGQLQLFVLGHDVMFAKETSEEIVQRLQSPASAALQGLSFNERKDMLKRSKAITSLQFGIAGLTAYTWAVTFGTCDETLNQLIFFLSI